jgi:hypothetical protein
MLHTLLNAKEIFVNASMNKRHLFGPTPSVAWTASFGDRRSRTAPVGERSCLAAEELPTTASTALDVDHGRMHSLARERDSGRK